MRLLAYTKLPCTGRVSGFGYARRRMRGGKKVSGVRRHLRLIQNVGFSSFERWNRSSRTLGEIDDDA